MPVDNSASATASALGAAALNTTNVPKKELAPDDFITLFLAQMKNQNPMSPTDSSAILQQMAQISSISASKSMQDTLKDVSKNVSSALSNSQVLQATQLIGKRVEVPSKVSPFSPTDGLSGSALLPAPAEAVTITIKDMAGNVIKTINNGPSASGGLIDFKWDGIGNNGTTQTTEGVYQVVATAVMNGKSMEVPTAGSFKVNSVAVNQKDGGVVLNLEQMGGTSMGDIVKIL